VTVTSRLVDACTGAPTPDADPFAPDPRQLVDVDHPGAALSRDQVDARARGGVWRFRELVDPALPAGEEVSLAEGDTPLLDCPDLARYAGTSHLAVKHEGRNPTGSFKDRGMTVAVSRARHLGHEVLACASTGNTAASLAAYAARAGLRAAIVVPADATASGKLSQAVAHGARAVQVEGDFDAAMRLVLELARSGDVALVNSANPWRVEGQKTIVFELLAQLGWDPPDWLVFPAGNLGNAAAFGKALREARALGWIERAPRLAAVQAAGAAPFAASFAKDFASLEPVAAETIATAIRIGAPVSFPRAIAGLRETDGVVLAVDDGAILDAKAVVDAAGIGAEPASCASVAGARAQAEAGTIRPGERVVCLLTGHLLKDPETTLAYHEGRLGPAARANAPVRVPAKLEALRGVLRGG